MIRFRPYVLALSLAIGAVMGVAFSQTTRPIITALVGNEFVQVESQVNNTTAITYTTVASLRDGRMYVYNVPVTGFTITMTVLQSALSLNPAGTLATGTIVLPPTATDGKYVTLFSSQTITALTLSTSNGAAITNPVTTLAANGPVVGYIYSLSANAWRRIF